MRLIVVVDEKWGIGRNNGLLFRLKKDMRRFREITTGKVIVVGANTFRSFPNGALPNRVNIVLDDKGATFENAITVTNTDELVSVLHNYDDNDVFVCGGASVYKLMLDCCDKALITKVKADGNAEVFFPNLDNLSNWRLVEQSSEIEDGDYVITFCEYHNSKFLR